MPSGTGPSSLPPAWAQSPLGGLSRLRTHRTVQPSSFDTTGGNHDYVPIGPGETHVLAQEKGAGCVRRIWLTIASPDQYILRRAVLQAFWDGADQPSVNVPVGDFFGAAFGEKGHYVADPMGISSGGFFCYLPMPFAKGMRLELVNESPYPINAFYYHVTIDKLKATDVKDHGRFHACWARATTVKGENFSLLETTGRGHYAGCHLQMQGTIPFFLWFLEGDEMIYVDGEDHPPAFHGTGTEDYFNGGWYFDRGPFTGPWHGVTVKQPHWPRVAAYRFHLEDPIPFHESLRVTFEHGGTNDVPGSDYTGTAYWYQDRPVAAAPLPPPEERLPKDGPLITPGKEAASQLLKVGFTAFETVRDLFSPYPGR